MRILDDSEILVLSSISVWLHAFIFTVLTLVQNSLGIYMFQPQAYLCSRNSNFPNEEFARARFNFGFHFPTFWNRWLREYTCAEIPGFMWCFIDCVLSFSWATYQFLSCLLGSENPVRSKVYRASRNSCMAARKELINSLTGYDVPCSSVRSDNTEEKRGRCVYFVRGVILQRVVGQ